MRAAVRVLEDAFARTGLSASRGSPLRGLRVARPPHRRVNLDAGAGRGHRRRRACRWRGSNRRSSGQRVKGDLVRQGTTGAACQRHRRPHVHRGRTAGGPRVARRLELQHGARHQPDVRTDGAAAGPGIRYRVRGGHSGPWRAVGTPRPGRTGRRDHRAPKPSRHSSYCVSWPASRWRGSDRAKSIPAPPGATSRLHVPSPWRSSSSVRRRWYQEILPRAGMPRAHVRLRLSVGSYQW